MSHLLSLWTLWHDYIVLWHGVMTWVLHMIFFSFIGVNKIWFIHKIEYYLAITKWIITDSCYNMDEASKHCAKWRKPISKGHIWYHSVKTEWMEWDIPCKAGEICKYGLEIGFFFSFCKLGHISFSYFFSSSSSSYFLFCTFRYIGLLE